MVLASKVRVNGKVMRKIMRKAMINPPSIFSRNGRLMGAGKTPRSLTQDYPGQFKQRNSPPGVLSAAIPLRAGSTVK